MPTSSPLVLTDTRTHRDDNFRRPFAAHDARVLAALGEALDG